MGSRHQGWSRGLVGDIDPSVAGAAAPIGSLYASDVDGTIWTKTGPDDTDWTLLMPSSSSSVLVWGADSIGAAIDTRYLAPGHVAGLAPTSSIYGIVIPRAGTLRNLFARHNAAVGNGNPVVYTVQKNGVDTTIACSLVTGAIGSASDLVHTVAIAQGDRVTIRASKAAVVGGGSLQVQTTLELV